jgi:hypothetical protein
VRRRKSKTFKVFIIESERGWGTRVDETKEFPTREEAYQFCKEYNNKYNPPGGSPDWYMYARMEEQQGYGMIR